MICLKEDFYNYFRTCLLEDKLPHAFLIETDGLEIQFEKIIKLLYENQLIRSEDYINNLNLVIIEPEGKEIKSDSITGLQKRFSTKPVNDKYNIFVIKNAEKMNISSANKILKFLEEPNSYTFGILIAATSQVLPTIKSRCQIFKVLNDLEETSLNEESDLLSKLLSDFNIEKEIELKKKFSKIDRLELITIFENSIKKYNQNISQEKLSIIRMHQLSKEVIVMENILRLLKSNVNIELVLDKLCIEVRN